MQKRFSEAAADYKKFITANPNIIGSRSDYISVRLIYIKLLKRLNELNEATIETKKLLNLKNLNKKEKLEISQKLSVIPRIKWLTDEEDNNLKNNLETYLKAKDSFEQAIDNLESGLQFKNKGDNVQAKKFLLAAQKVFEDSKNLLEDSDDSFDANNNLKRLIYRQLAIVHFHLQNYRPAIFNFSLTPELDDWCHLQRAICFFKINMIDIANGDFFKGCELVLIRIYHRTNQFLPTTEKERNTEIQKFINELINSPAQLDEYFPFGSMTHTLLKEAFTCYISADKTKINHCDEPNAALLVANGLFKVVEQNTKQTVPLTKVLPSQPRNEQEVEQRESVTNLWVMD